MCYQSQKQLWFTYVGLRKYKPLFKLAEVEVKKAFQEFFNLLLCPQIVFWRVYKAASDGKSIVNMNCLLKVSNYKTKILTQKSSPLCPLLSRDFEQHKEVKCMILDHEVL